MCLLIERRVSLKIGIFCDCGVRAFVHFDSYNAISLNKCENEIGKAYKEKGKKRLEKSEKHPRLPHIISKT